MRNLRNRVEALEAEAAPFAGIHFHIVPLPSGQSREEALAGHADPIAPEDGVIFLRGVKPSHG